MAGRRDRDNHTSESASASASASAVALAERGSASTGRGRQPIAPRARWLEENRDAIASFNEWVELHGLPLGKFRRF